MDISFFDRNPTGIEERHFQLSMSVFKDGSGQEKEKDGSTRPGWRDFERITAEIMNGLGTESKDVFDVIVKSKRKEEEYYGISVKSKELSRVSAIDDLETGGRVHMELSNSPAKFWDALRIKGVSENDFLTGKKASTIGNTIIDVVESWHDDAATKFNSEHQKLNISKSIYFTVSYSKIRNGQSRKFQLHSFSMKLPRKLKWKFTSTRCLRGYDVNFPEETLIEWYGLSGGQLKYYPRANDAMYKSKKFELVCPPIQTIKDKAQDYWPELWDKKLT